MISERPESSAAGAVVAVAAELAAALAAASVAGKAQSRSDADARTQQCGRHDSTPVLQDRFERNLIA